MINSEFCLLGVKFFNRTSEYVCVCVCDVLVQKKRQFVGEFSFIFASLSTTAQVLLSFKAWTS